MSVRPIRSLTLLALAAAGMAEDQPVPAVQPELVVTAERRTSERDRASAPVEVVDREDIDERGGVLNAEDRLRRLPGVSVLHTSDIPTVTMRGTRTEHVVQLIDGVPVSDPATTQGQRSMAHLLVPGEDCTEVVKGTQSGLYGSRAIGGVVNHRTLAAGGPAAAELSATAGSFDTRGASIRASGQPGEDTGVAVAVDTQASGGWSATTPVARDGDPDGAERDSFRRAAALAKLQHRLDERWSVSTAALGSAIDQEYDASDPLTYATDPADGVSVIHDRFARLQVGSRFDGGSRGDAALDLAWSRDRREHEQAASEDAYRSGEWYGQGRGTVEALDGLKLTLGGDGRHAWADTSGGVHAAENQGGAWTQAAWGTRFSELTLTGRGDRVGGYDPHATGRAGLALLPMRQVTVRAAVANGYRAPSLYERYVDVPAWSFTGNPDLQPETTRQGEAGLDLRPVEGVTLSGTAFRTLFDRRIAYVYDPLTWASTYENEDAASRSDGIETALAAAPAWSPASGRVWYTLTRTRDSAGQAFLNQPRHQLGAELTVRQQTGRWRTWQQVALERHTGYLVYGPLQVADRNLVSAALGAEFDGRYELSLRGENLLDETAAPGNADAGSNYTEMPLAVFISGTVRL